MDNLRRQNKTGKVKISLVILGTLVLFVSSVILSSRLPQSFAQTESVRIIRATYAIASISRDTNAEYYNDWASGLDDAVTIDGFTTDATHYVKISVPSVSSDGVSQLRLPDSDMRNGLEVFIIGSEVNEVKIIHGKQMEGIIGKQTKMVQLRKIFNNNMLGRFYNA